MRESPTLGAAARRDKMRRVVINEDYLDGIEGLSVNMPGAWDREVVEIPDAVFRRYQAADREMRAAEDAVRAAWVTGRRRKNPKYVPTIEETDDDDSE